MAGETSGPGPSEQEIRMVALERKFDELLSFVQLIAKRNTDDENQRKEDDKDTSEAEPEGHSNTNATPPRPPTPPKPEGKDSQLDSKIDSLEEKIRLIQGLNSFGNTDFFEHVLVPQHDGATQVQGPGVREIQWERRPHDPSANLKKISHWKELADTFLAQYGFNSQIAPDRFDLQRMEKKSNETFREYAQRWREKAARARPPLDEREMIKIFVDTLKNPYFDRMMGLQMQFFVDLIPVGERIEDALKTKKIVDMTALMALAEQAAKKAPTKRKEGDAPAPAQVPAPALAPQVPARPVGNQPNDNRWPRKELRQFTPLPMPLTELYPILIEKSLISPVVPRPYNGPQRRDFNPNSTCDFHFGEVGHTVENCGQLKHRVQDLIDHGVLKFEGLPNITTNPLPNHPEGGVNMVEIEEGNEERIAWRRLFYTLEKKRHITPLDAPPGPSTGDACEYHSGARGHSLECCEEFKKKITNLMENGLRDVDFTEFFQFPCLIVPPGFVTPEFEIFYEDGDPEVHLQKYGEKMALHLENELLMISVFPESLSKQTAAWFYQLRNLTGWDDLVRVFLERYRFNPHSILEYLGLKKDEEPYIIPDPGTLTEGGEEEKDKPPPPAKEPSNVITTTTAEEEYAGPMVEGLSIHTITEEEDSTTTPPTRHCQQGEEANEGEEPREVKIGTRCAAEQKEALIALLREFHEIFAWSYQDMPGLDTDIVVHKIPLKPECKPVKQALRPDEARSHFEDQGRGGKAIEGRFPKHSNLFGLGSQYSPGAEKGRKTTNVVFSFMDGFSGYNQIKMAEEDKSKTAFVTHWGTFVYDVMPFGLKERRSHLSASHAYGEPASLCSSLLRKDVKIKWTEDCQKAFDKIKEYLLNPPILVPPTPGRPLILYLTVQEASMGCMLGQQDETGKKEQAIYYLSKKFTEPETRYLLVEKTCCALAWASKKLRQYMLYYTTWLVSRNGPDQAIKGQAIADYLADYPSEQLELNGLRVPRRRLSQTNGEWQARDPKLIPYQRYISRLIPKFKYVTFTYTPRAHNHFADALATLASLIKLVEGDDVRPLRIETRDIPAYCVCIEECMNVEAEIDDKPWYYDIKRFIQDREFLYKRTHDATLLRCVDAEEANRLIQEMHAGLMGAHANGPFLARKIMRAGYYWLTMERDCIRHVQTCHKCQMYQNSKNAPPQYLHTMASPWPFSAWGMDVIGAITPKASNGHEFILVAIDYFTKWVEACSFKNVTQVAVTRFVKNNIICRYGMPEMLITDNASNLNNRMMDQLCQQFKIQHHNSAPYRPKMNGAVEAANKNVKKILSKMTETYKDWHEHLPYALCAYRTSVRTSVGATPYSLVYGMEAVLPVEVEIPSLRILSTRGRIERAYNKKARPRTFQPGDLVLKKRNMALSDPRGKFAPSYEGPYVVKKAFSGGAIILADMDGEEFRSPINSDSVIKYHV
uniref:Integrase catalytic domain-containing protein n=1 Tax=Fagus sylvatica TaxID=28930 RepID=A0A2N9GVW2_FAGSY